MLQKYNSDNPNEELIKLFKRLIQDHKPLIREMVTY